ncbi:MAG TPA: hypothetical protein VKB30_07820 [Candidatus Limnocylindrales bacterium]|nr:hypothetical protein [Candidatus Limnocylindrales bacterium]
MEHDEALERIDIAAAEPDGLERLMAGDTAEAAAVAGHLAGCAACTAELARIRRVSVIARDAVRAQPDPELRERTLAFVRAAGVPRGPAAAPGPAAPVAAVAASDVVAASPLEIGAAPATRPRALDEARRRRESRGLRTAVAALAAALVIAVGAGVVAYRSLSAEMAAMQEEQAQQIAVLDATTRATIAVTAEPDARRVPLTAPSGTGDAAGTLLFSPSTGELVAVASNLVPEEDGQEYGCWIEVDGTRTRIGKMYWAGDLWAWAGPVPGLADVPAGTMFGVSLGPVDGAAGSTPVLTGEL